MKIFIDDYLPRSTPYGWYRTFDVLDLMHMVLNNPNQVTDISLDEDFQVVNFLEREFHTNGENFLPNLKRVNIHSANSARRDDMLRGMEAINRRFNNRQIEVTVVEFQLL